MASLATTAANVFVSGRQTEENKDAGQELLDLLKNPFSGTLAATSIWAALATSVGFTVLATIFFSFLRPYHQALYAPKMKHADDKHAPPPIGKKPWSWFTTLWQATEEQMIQQIGMDATIFIRFVRMCRNIFLTLSVLGVAILAPVHYQGFNNIGTYGDKEYWLVKLTPQNSSGPAQWAQVVVAYIFNIVVAGFLWWNYRKVTVLRRTYFDSEDYQNSLHARSLMLFDIPKQGRSDEGIARIIDSVVPNSSFARTAVARNVKDLPDLIKQHEHAVRKLEKILAKYLKNPDKMPAGRPTCSPSKKDRAYSTYPKGQKLDAIEYYTERIRQLEIEIKEVRASVDKRGTMSYGFASYADIIEAHNIAYACRKKKPHGTTVVLAPRPNDIIWDNMSMTPAARTRNGWINGFWILLLTFLWIAPNAMIAIFLVNLGNLGNFWDGFQRSLESSPQGWGIVQGILSPAIMSLVYLVLPMIFRRFQIKAGDKTKTGRERHVLGKLYGFFVFNNLVVFTMFSVIWSFVAGVKGQTDSGEDAWNAILKQDLARSTFIAMCQNSPFWVTYLLQRQLGAAVDLAQLWPLIEAFFAKKFSSPTPRELIEMTAPPPFEYASYYNYFLFYATVTLCFGGIQPLVLPATALYFSIDLWLKKYLLLYRFVTKTESGGVFWRALFNRFVFATMLANLVVMLTTWCQGDANHIQFFAVIPLPFLMIGFKIYCAKVFDDRMRYYSTRIMNKTPEGALRNDDRGRGDRLASRFGHPVLYNKLITPMVHQSAQSLLPAVYRGRLTDGREAGTDDMMSVSGYSDMYALKDMGNKPGKGANNGVPGFEFVSESHMDFEYYKNRAEFAEDHGGGEIYGRPGELTRPMTPGSFGEGSETGSRPGTPLSGRTTPFAPRAAAGGPRRAPTAPMDYDAYRPQYGGAPDAGVSSPGAIGRMHSPLYTHDNGSGSGLVSNAQPPPMSATTDRRGPSPMGGDRPVPARSHSPGPSMGALGGGPHGYSGLAQAEAQDNTATEDYSYFRGSARGGRKTPGQGW